MNVVLLRQSLAAFTLLTCYFFPSHAQTPATRGTCVVTGRVIVGEKPAANVLVGLIRVETNVPSSGGAAAKVQTDSEGRFRLEQIAAGNYRLAPLAPGYVVEGETPGFYEQGKVVQLRDGETADGLEFKLTRGGVITGKITDTDGKPLIEQRLTVTKLEADGRKSAWSSAANYQIQMTDDRGVYRLYGLPEGRYLVSAGTAGSGQPSLQNRGQIYRRTFYPDAPDENQAKPVEVSPGSEAKDIDLRLVPDTTKGYGVTVRVVDAETSAPLAAATLFWGTFNGEFLNSMTVAITDSQGIARLEGVQPGRYGVQLRSEGHAEYFSETSTFEVSGGELETVLLRAQRGGSITGRLVLEGVADPSLQAKLAQLRLSAFSRPVVTPGAGSPPPMPMTSATTQLKPDGTFRTVGLPPGKVTFNASAPAGLQGFTLMRTELEGVPQDGIEISAGQQIANVRLVFGYGQTVVRGQVRVVNGVLPEGARMTAVLQRSDGQKTGFKGAQVDARGQFSIEGVMAGEYELTLTALPPLRVYVGNDGRTTGTSSGTTPGFPRKVTQKLLVPPTGEIPVNLTLDLTPQEK